MSRMKVGDVLHIRTNEETKTVSGKFLCSSKLVVHCVAVDPKHLKTIAPLTETDGIECCVIRIAADQIVERCDRRTSSTMQQF